MAYETMDREVTIIPGQNARVLNDQRKRRSLAEMKYDQPW